MSTLFTHEAGYLGSSDAAGIFFWSAVEGAFHLSGVILDHIFNGMVRVKRMDD